MLKSQNTINWTKWFALTDRVAAVDALGGCWGDITDPLFLVHHFHHSFTVIQAVTSLKRYSYSKREETLCVADVFKSEHAADQLLWPWHHERAKAVHCLTRDDLRDFQGGS